MCLLLELGLLPVCDVSTYSENRNGVSVCRNQAVFSVLFSSLNHKRMALFLLATRSPICNAKIDGKINKLTASAALRALSLVTSSTVPWISTRSTFWFRSSMTPSRMAWTSASLFLLPVMKLRWAGTEGDILNVLESLVLNKSFFGC